MPTASGRIAVRRKAKDGEQGLPGLILRTSEWQNGVEYHNDTDLPGGIRYLDIVVVTTGLNNFSVYQCKVTHTASSINQPGNTVYWAPFNVMAPIYSPLILADNALLRFAQTNQLLVMKADGTTVNVGLGGGNYPFWIGAVQPANAPCKIDQDGILYAQSAVFENPILQNDSYELSIDHEGVSSGQIVDSIYRLDCKQYRIFDFDFNAPEFVDARDIQRDGIARERNEDFYFYIAATGNMAFKPGVIYTVNLKVRHKTNQEVAHVDNPDYEWYHDHTPAYDSEGPNPLVWLRIYIKNLTNNTQIGPVQQNLGSGDFELYPKMVLRIEPGNGQFCTIQFMVSTGGQIRIVNFYSSYINNSINYM